MKLEELSDRAEIHDVLMRYSRGLDRLDMDLVREAFHDDAWVDFPEDVYVGQLSRGFATFSPQRCRRLLEHDTASAMC